MNYIRITKDNIGLRHYVIVSADYGRSRTTEI
mgnify:CR=1 FL=1